MILSLIAPEILLEIHRWSSCPIRHLIEEAVGWKTPTRHVKKTDPHSIFHWMGDLISFEPMSCYEDIYYDMGTRVKQFQTTVQLPPATLPNVWDTFRMIDFQYQYVFTRRNLPDSAWKKEGPLKWILQTEWSSAHNYYQDENRRIIIGNTGTFVDVIPWNRCWVNWLPRTDGGDHDESNLTSSIGEFRETKLYCHSRGMEDLRYYRTVIFQIGEKFLWKTEECNRSFWPLNPQSG